MHAVSPHLFQKLVGKKLLAEVQHVIGVGKQGFDLRVKTDSSVLLVVFEVLLTQTCNEELHAVHRVHTIEELVAIREHDLSHGVFTPTVLLSQGHIGEGAGLVEHALPPVVDLLPPCSASVRLVLEHHGLGVFLPVFGPERLSSLKPFLARGNLTSFIDATIQTAYLEGARGDSDQAADHLRKLNRGLGMESDAVFEVETLARSLQWVLSRDPSPHQFSKALLSYFVVHVKNLTLSQSSQALGISRTTLQLHLQLAEKLAVPEIFGHTRNRLRPA